MKKILGILIFSILLSVNVLASNQALSVDGEGDYVELFANQDEIYEEFTISFWVFWDGSNSVMPIGNWNIDETNGGYVYFNGFDFLVNFYGDTNYYPNNNILTINTWMFCSVNCNGNTVRLFVDGTEINSASRNYQIYNSWRFGWSYNQYYFSGLIDEVRIWNYARTSEEIQEDMLNLLIGNESGLVGYWNFNNGTADDLTTYSNDGIFFGDASIIYATIPGFQDFQADFISPERAYIGEQIQFIDISTGNITSWEWDFENDGIYDSTYSSYQDTIYWTYESTDVDSVKLRISNDTVVDSLTKAISVVYCPPASPDSVQLTLNYPDVTISWTEVDTTICGSSITPDLYIIQYSETAEDSLFYYLSSVFNPTTEFIHFRVLQYGNNGEPSDHMFYKVIAIKNYTREQIEYLEKLYNSREKVKWTEVKRNLETKKNRNVRCSIENLVFFSKYNLTN